MTASASVAAATTRGRCSRITTTCSSAGRVPGGSGTPTVRVSAVWCEVKLLNVIVELVLLKEGFQLFLGGKFDPARAIYVDVPSASLFAMFATFQLSNPARWQCFILELEHFG